ncbi:MAG: DUF2029 domain-containing protein [Armatimonadetes bacterium]|nr:DUF2029 domain-containing protein [Armatimonadota bacterium]
MDAARVRRLTPRSRQGSVVAKVAVGLAVLWSIAACASLVRRVQHGQTDFSVYYRSALAVRGGVGPEFYRQTDEPTGWLYCIPPPGTMLFAYMPWLSIGAAAVVWGLLNLALLALCGWALWRIVGRLERHRRLYQSAAPWALFLLLILSTDSLQVGQFSVLFVACWLLYLAVDHELLGAALLALPATIKLYPALLWGAPMALRDWRRVRWLAPATLVIGLVLPLALYGARLPGMWGGFLSATLFGGTKSRLMVSLNPDLATQQSLDVTLLRYLADLPDFAQTHPGFPHLRLDAGLVLGLAVLLKLCILVATAAAAWRLGARASRQPRWTALLMLALWSAAMWLLLPDTKSRYAVYLFVAYLPLLAMTAAQRGRPWRYAGCCLLLALGVASIVQAMPHALRLYSPACFASLAIWAIVLRTAWQDRPRAGDVAAAPAIPSQDSP